MQLSVTLRYLSYDYTLRKPAQRSTATGIFGVPIEEVCQREKRPIPYLVSCCVREVERRGLDEVGIYRVSGSATDIAKLRKSFDTRKPVSQLNFIHVLFSRSFFMMKHRFTPFFLFITGGSESELLLREVDINSVSGLLKLYLRQLPEALFTDKLYPLFLNAFSNLDHAALMSGQEDLSLDGGDRLLTKLFSSLPRVSQNVIFYLLEHLIR